MFGGLRFEDEEKSKDFVRVGEGLIKVEFHEHHSW